MRDSNRKDIQKIQSLIARNVKDIVSYEIKNENVGFMTITNVEVSSDHSYCTIFVSFLNNAKNSLDTLNRARGFVRSRLAKKIQLRRVPEIRFVLDDTFERQQRLENLIKKDGEELEELKKTILNKKKFLI